MVKTILLIGAALACMFLVAANTTQTSTVHMSNAPDAPAQVVSAQCGLMPNRRNEGSCEAEIRVDGDDVSALGILWALKLSDGSSSVVRTSTDIGMSRAAFNQGEVTTCDAPGLHYLGKDGTSLTIVDATASLEFVIRNSHRPWGDLKSPQYLQALGMRNGFKQAMARLKHVYSTQGVEGLKKEIGVQ